MNGEQQHFSAAELAGLPGMPKHPQDVAAAMRTKPGRKRAGRGGPQEWPLSALPEATKIALFERQLLKSSPPVAAAPPHAATVPPGEAAGAFSSQVGRAARAPAPAEQPSSIGALAEWQINVARARLVFVAEIEAGAPQIGVNRAARAIERLARAGKLPEHLQALVRVANARAGKKGRTLSCARLIAWRGAVRTITDPQQRVLALAPLSRGKRWIPDDEVIAALALYRQANKPSLARCVRDVIATRGGNFGSLEHRCRRALEMLPTALFYAGRNTGAALRALRPFRRREFLSLAPNDVWVGDGHGAKLKVAHPVTGNPFVPEVTAIMDVADRYCVGWSVALSENCIAVSDALRHAVANHGIPLIYYSDNGGGQSNQMFDAPVTGMLGALGIQHEVGIPGNPQGRGVIERFWQTVLIPLAQRFATFQGKSADRDTLKNVSREIDRALRAAKRSAEVAVLPRRLPTWQQFLDALSQGIESYNATHRHCSLPKLDGRGHATPAEYRAHRIAETGVEIHRPEGAELATLFMPSIERTVSRGEVKFLNGIYFHRDLMLIDGEKAQVFYDIHDCSRVWVKKSEFMVEALLNGNRDGYMPKALIERLREERAARRMALLTSKMDEVQAEFDGGLAMQEAAGRAVIEIPVEQPAASMPAAESVVMLPGVGARPRTANDLDLLYWLAKHPGEIDEYDRDWIEDARARSDTFDMEFVRLFGPIASKDAGAACERAAEA